MKPRFAPSLVLAALALTLALAMPAAAQRPSSQAAAQVAAPVTAPLRLASLQALESRADEVVEITLDGELLRLAAGLVGDDAGSDPELRALLGQLQGIYVNSYTFAADGAYDRGLVDRLRSGLGQDWRRMVNVRSRDAENVEIWVHPAGSRFDGLVIFAAEPRELTVVQLVGPVDVESLARLEGHLGVPRLGVDAGSAKVAP